eukprot:7324495-Prymnesium_polylepis.1
MRPRARGTSCAARSTGRRTFGRAARRSGRRRGRGRGRGVARRRAGRARAAWCRTHRRGGSRSGQSAWQ